MCGNEFTLEWEINSKRVYGELEKTIEIKNEKNELRIKN